MPGKAKRRGRATAAPRTTIAVQGARVHNLKNVSLELPRDRLIVVTGLSGSGKSSLAFDTIYAEGQRRYMESLSTYAKRFVAQVAKPDVDFVFGLSPVISIEQKTIGSNPRSTVGTMTDIASYLNLLFATIAEPHCPRTGERVAEPHAEPDPGSDPVAAGRRGDRTARAGLQGLRRGTGLRLHRGPQEGLPAARRSTASASISPTSSRSTKTTVRDMDAVVDRFVVGAKHEKAIKAGDRRHAAGGRRPDAGRRCSRAPQGGGRALLQGLCSPTHHFVYGGIEPEYFMFNNPESACRTCGGLGVHKITHPELLVPDPKRSIRGGCFVREAFKYNPGHLGRPHHVQPVEDAAASRSTRRGRSCPRRRATRSSTASTARSCAIVCRPMRRSSATNSEGNEVGFGGIARRIERHYRRYRQRGEASSGMEEWLDKVMVERTCPDCNGARLRATRLLFTIAGKTHPRRRRPQLRRAARLPRRAQAGGPRRRRGPPGAGRDPRPPGTAARASASTI